MTGGIEIPLPTVLASGDRLPLAIHNHRPHGNFSGGSGGLGEVLEVADDAALAQLLQGIEAGTGSSRIGACSQACIHLPQPGPEQAPWADLALATAGTATEQVVGLGIPALSLPGPGPQFKASFARRQSRLLGGAVVPCHSPTQVAERLALLLQDANLRLQLGAIGRRRMGPPGGSNGLASLVDQRLLG